MDTEGNLVGPEQQAVGTLMPRIQAPRIQAPRTQDLQIPDPRIKSPPVNIIQSFA